MLRIKTFLTKMKKIFFLNLISFSRMLLALSTLLTLVFGGLTDNFRNTHLSLLKENMSGIMSLNMFLWEWNLIIPYTICLIILILVIIGFMPRLTCILHSWVSYSVFYSMLIVEGGDQLNVILTLLLIPICFVDNRLISWTSCKSQIPKWDFNNLLPFNKLIALFVIQLQMAFLYFNAGISKVFAPEWNNGTALYYWFNENIFGAPPIISKSIGWIFTNNWSVTILTWGVILLEIFAGLAIFFKPKIKFKIGLILILFHISIFLIHGLATFLLSMTAGIILYLFPLQKTLNANFLDLKKIIYARIS